MSINESKQLHDNFIRMTLEAISCDDFEFIEESIKYYSVAMGQPASEHSLLTKAFNAGAVKSFKVLLSKLDFANKASQLNVIETLIKQRLSAIAEVDSQKVSNELDMVVEFSSLALEQQLLDHSENRIEPVFHILLFKAYIARCGLSPYEYLKIAKNEKEKFLCVELIAEPSSLYGKGN
jgi:hypothetical protein